MILDKDKAKRGDQFLEILCEEGEISNVGKYFKDENQALSVCRILESKEIIKFIEVDTPPFNFVHPTSHAWSYLQNGGLQKEYEDNIKEEESINRKYTLEGWQYYTFWFTTLLGIISVLYNLIDWLF